MATLNDVLQETRIDLYERSPGLWADSDIAVWLNQGIQKVVIALKAIREDYFVKRIQSDDSSLTILGESYNPTSLAIVSGTDIYTLPNDLLEIRSIEPLSQTDRDSGIRFFAGDFSDLAFQEARRLSASTTGSWHRYYFDLYGRNQIIYAPTPQQAIGIEIFYTAITQTYAIGDTLDIPIWSFNAVKTYAKYRALKSINHPDVPTEFAQFKEEIADCRSFATPRQSQEVKYAEGVFDETDMFPYPVMEVDS